MAGHGFLTCDRATLVSFTFVRNPWSRLASAYLSKIARPRGKALRDPAALAIQVRIRGLFGLAADARISFGHRALGRPAECEHDEPAPAPHADRPRHAAHAVRVHRAVRDDAGGHPPRRRPSAGARRSSSPPTGRRSTPASGRGRRRATSRACSASCTRRSSSTSSRASTATTLCPSPYFPRPMHDTLSSGEPVRLRAPAAASERVRARGCCAPWQRAEILAPSLSSCI